MGVRRAGVQTRVEGCSAGVRRAGAEGGGGLEGRGGWRPGVAGVQSCSAGVTGSLG